jgi:hypothetical protein
MRVVEAPVDDGTNQFTIAQVLFSDDQFRTFGFSVSMESDGSPLVNVGSEESPRIIDLGDLDSGYHLYELEYDPATRQASLFVDEVRRASQVHSFVDRARRFVSSVDFGSTYRGGFGHANYNLVKYEITTTPEPTDFDGDGHADIQDLNTLLAEGPLANGVPVVVGQTELFDLTGDGVINMDDVSQWLSSAATANGLASPYKYGDANLDGTVDVTDFNLWNTHKFSYSLAWDDGDFNGTGTVDVSDFLVWNNHKSTSSDGLTTVPESGWVMMLVPVAVSVIMLKTRRRRRG